MRTFVLSLCIRSPLSVAASLSICPAGEGNGQMVGKGKESAILQPFTAGRFDTGIKLKGVRSTDGSKPPDHGMPW